MSAQALRARVVQCYHRARFGPVPAFDNAPYKLSMIMKAGFFPRLTFWLPALLAVVLAPAMVQAREFTFEYAVTIGPVADSKGPLHVFVPLAANSPQQQVLEETIVSSITGDIETETVYGNRFWHCVVEQPAGEVIELTIRSRVMRQAAVQPLPASSPSLTPAEREKQALFLQANELVPIKHPLLAPILEEIDSAAASDDSTDLSRAIYDWVVDNVEYKKIGTGWGNGDTFWACNERYGNCTDFHALYISLARSRDIPARFEIGFPVPEDRPSGTVGGYHCWVQVYLPGADWFGIDASEAAKDPLRRDYFYGSQPSDRIHFSTGRDIVLSPDQRSGPLNYFIYPLVEVAGERYTGPVVSRFSYQAVEGLAVQ
jgi:transglutaminase-like putative cysteine protease